MADQPQRISIQPAIETDTAMPIRASKSVRIGPAIEHDVALPLTIQRAVPAAIAGGGTVELQVSSTSPLSPRALTAEEQTIIG